MGGWCEGRCQEAGREKLEECCKEEGQLAEASKEGLGSEWAVVPMMMMMMIVAKIMTLFHKFMHDKRKLHLTNRI
jgi:hypothetical protein